MKTNYDIIIRPRLTEKSSKLQEPASDDKKRRGQYNTYVFEVAKKATKPQIKKTIENAYGVTVSKIRTAVCAGKPKRLGRWNFRSPSYKKAMVTIAEGQSINFYEDV